MKHVNLPQWRTANDLDKNAYKIYTTEKLSNIKFQSMHCFVKSLIVLFIVGILTYFIKTL